MSHVVTRKKDQAQVHVLREFETHVVWTPVTGNKAPTSAWELAPATLFWRQHERHRLFACGHQGKSDQHQCYTCNNQSNRARAALRAASRCTDGRRNHALSRQVNFERTCSHCGVVLVYDPVTLNLKSFRRKG